jgi:hypothetical protein
VNILVSATKGAMIALLRLFALLGGNLRVAKVASTADIGLSYREIHEGREIRDAEDAEPGVNHGEEGGEARQG